MGSVSKKNFLLPPSCFCVCVHLENETEMARPHAATDYLERQMSQHPELAEKTAQLAELYKKKLWHQLTEALFDYVKSPSLQQGAELASFYEDFVKDFETKINQLRLVQLAVFISERLTNSEEALTFLKTVGDKVTADKEASMLAQAEQAALKLKLNRLDETLDVIEKLKADLEGTAGLDAVVHSAVFRVAASYYKQKTNAELFYKNALMYLAYTPEESLSHATKVSWALDLGLAALIGLNTYNFGELLEQPVLKSLEGSQYHWLGQLLHAFNAGNMTDFERLFATYQPQIAEQSALTANMPFLREKMVILVLVELVFNRPKGDRNVPLTDIAQAAKIPLDQVEVMVMRAMSLGIIKGVIDQVEGIVRVTWVQPRMLDATRVAVMKDKLSEWTSNVRNILVGLEQQTPELFV
eukprot:GILK01001951.1.p1 GENE.GILK01001951.1~~GILK01001951.1.p1  ORF type:complete len:412 (+),score=62.96 GILK01001951.1:17-1252(+)